MNLTKALELLRRFEGCRLTAYQDQGGVWTIGYGTTGPSITEGLTITQTEAEDLLLSKAQYFSNEIYKRLPLLNENPHCALVSFTYNVGLGNFLGSTMYKKLLEVLPLTEIANEFPRWDKVKGEVVEGLIKRREAEKELFLT